MANKFYYCPRCGEIQRKTNVICINCRVSINPVESNYDEDFYKSQSISKYGNEDKWFEFLLPEIENSQNFDKSKCNFDQSPNPDKKIITQQQYYNRENTDNINVPKCPTCGSTKIKNISTLKRAAHAYAFGIFSKTARSQFECCNCGYKW